MEDFHFIRPLWLLGFIALILLIRELKKIRVASSAWHKVIPKHLTTMLLSNDENKKPISLLLPTLIGSLMIIALAGPTWKKIPQPVFEVERGSIVVMDMSFSMLSTDIKPNRLTRARFKAMDLIDQINEGEMGLIAYAGDAFVISPLTADINNLKLLLPSLSPDIMPELGSNPLPAIYLANEMLLNAGHIEGDIYWITDGVTSDELQDLQEVVSEFNHRVNILGVGTAEGAPITLANGELMKDRSGNIVIPKLENGLLQGISQRSTGLYRDISNDDSDIVALAQPPLAKAKEMQEQEDNMGDQWHEMGPYLVIFMLPLVLVYFRKGVLFSTMLFATFLTSSLLPKPAHASLWDDLWSTQNQQASKKFDAEQYKEAAEQFNEKGWKASSYYRAGDYESALKEYQKVEGIDSTYNQANALAHLGKLDEAIEHYQKVLDENPAHEDAKANKALLEQMQQDQQNQDQQNQDQQNQDQQNQDQQNQDQQNQDQQNQDQQNQDQQNQDQQNQDQQNQDQQNQDQQNQDQQEQDQQEQDQQNQDQQNQDQQNQEQQEQQQQNLDQQEQEPQEQQQQQEAAMSEAERAKNNEENQKHEQLLRRVTDDPQLLLRNKMKLEYQKRRQNRSSIGVKEKW